MWVQDNARSSTDLLNDARAMRDETIARALAAGWRAMARFMSRVLHSGAQGQPRTH